MRHLYALSSTPDELCTLRLSYKQVHVPLVTGLAHTSGVLAALRRLTRGGFRPDVIHAHVHEAGLAALIVAQRYRVPLIISEHSSHFSLGTLPAAARLRAQFVFRSADRICPVSEDLRSHMERQGVRGRFEVVPNPVDPDIFAPGPPPGADHVRMLFVGGLDPIKRVDKLLTALAMVNRRDIRLDIVGDGVSRNKLEHQARDLGLNDAVCFHGYLPKPAVADRMRACHFLVLTSVVETFGTVMVEALSVGRPVVAVGVGAIPEIVDAHNGFVVATDSEPALASAIEQMAAQVGEFDWEALSSRAQGRFSLATVGERWNAIYRSVTS